MNLLGSQPPLGSLLLLPRLNRLNACSPKTDRTSWHTATAAAARRTPAEARLRLILHPVRRAASLYAVLTRPPGYPDRVTLLMGAGAEVEAYSEDRYDDVDLEWTPSLLSGEVRLECEERYQWLRSSRRVHIFSEVADEPGLISAGSAAVSSPSAIICRQDDTDAVRSAARTCGSAELVSHDRWTGVPDGWAVLSRDWRADTIGCMFVLKPGRWDGLYRQIRLSATIASWSLRL